MNCNKNGIKKEGESCTLNNNCIYPNCIKQETLEEAAERLYPNNKLFLERFQDIEKKAFINGYKLAQERMYSEEDMKLSFETGRNFQLTGEDNFNELIEQFKKK
jgi:hypothetical protein